jgi:hypothetical protein
MRRWLLFLTFLLRATDSQGMSWVFFITVGFKCLINFTDCIVVVTLRWDPCYTSAFVIFLGFNNFGKKLAHMARVIKIYLFVRAAYAFHRRIHHTTSLLLFSYFFWWNLAFLATSCAKHVIIIQLQSSSLIIAEAREDLTCSYGNWLPKLYLVLLLRLLNALIL